MASTLWCCLISQCSCKATTRIDDEVPPPIILQLATLMKNRDCHFMTPICMYGRCFKKHLFVKRELTFYRHLSQHVELFCPSDSLIPEMFAWGSVLFLFLVTHIFYSVSKCCCFTVGEIWFPPKWSAFLKNGTWRISCCKWVIALCLLCTKAHSLDL